MICEPCPETPRTRSVLLATTILMASGTVAYISTSRNQISSRLSNVSRCDTS